MVGGAAVGNCTVAFLAKGGTVVNCTAALLTRVRFHGFTFFRPIFNKTNKHTHTKERWIKIHGIIVTGKK